MKMQNILINHERAINIYDIKEVEDLLNYKFPESFVALYLKYNGGCPQKSYLCCSGGFEPLEVAYFMPIKYNMDDNNNPNSLLEGTYFLMKEKNVIPEELLPFAHDWGGNFFCLSMENNKIYFYVHDEFDPDLSMEENQIKAQRCVSDSFDDFINSLVTEEETYD